MSRNAEEMLSTFCRYSIFDLTEHFLDVRLREENNLIQVMKDIFAGTKKPFMILIDEWACFFREYQQDGDAQKQYLDFLRAWLKDKDYVALAYMAGILPKKKYGSPKVNSAESRREGPLGGSALNMFAEYSMADPGISVYG